MKGASVLPSNPSRTLLSQKMASGVQRSASSPDSTVGLASPNQRASRLLALASPDARNSYLNSLEAINEEFAQALREKGIQTPGGEIFAQSLPLMLPFSQSE